MQPNHPQRAYRKKHGLTQREWAARVGVSKFTVCEWESYRSVPQRRYWPKISEQSGGELTAPNDYALPMEAAE